MRLKFKDIPKNNLSEKKHKYQAVTKIPWIGR